MASATGIPPTNPDPETGVPRNNDETEPLLGRPGDASQKEDGPIIKNFVLGTGILAEAASLLLVASVWGAVFMHQPLILFSYHPLAQALGVLLLVQSILVLQPTHTLEQKALGQKIHAALNFFAFAVFVAGVTIIEINKFRAGPGSHFHSVHGYLGVITSVWLVLQYLVGFTMLNTPIIYGGETNAKKIWKYHRMSGYVLFVLIAVTVISATETDYNKNVLGLKLWAMILIWILLIAGIIPRVKKSKLGL